MSPRYHFVTEVGLTAPPDAVWEVLADSQTWPSWWPWLRRVEVLAKGDTDGMGRRVRNRVATPLRYRLTYQGEVVKSDRPRLLEFEASGDLVGRGRFHIIPAGDDGTKVVFHWLVRPTRFWMRLLGPVARPVFVWAHNVLMSDFADGLAYATGSRRVEVSNRSLARDHPNFYQLPPT